MRKVTRTVCEAFLNRKKKSCGNSSSSGDLLLLHGNIIAKHNEDGSITATLAGWGSVTTRERLNGLCQLLGVGGFRQRKWEQYFDGKPINVDEWVELIPAAKPVLSVQPEHA